MSSIPWIYGIKKRFVGIACVHECAFNLGSSLDVPRALIVNPQDLTGVEEVYDYGDRDPGFLSLQVFKSWKHVDQLIRAIPHLPHEGYFKKYVAGGGIEQRYMVAREKTKEKYFCRTAYDPDIPEYLDEIDKASGTPMLDKQRKLIEEAVKNNKYKHCICRGA